VKIIPTAVFAYFTHQSGFSGPRLFDGKRKPCARVGFEGFVCMADIRQETALRFQSSWMLSKSPYVTVADFLWGLPSIVVRVDLFTAWFQIKKRREETM